MQKYESKQDSSVKKLFFVTIVSSSSKNEFLESLTNNASNP
ncbi:MAG: hypothetical protein SGJ10_09460 [Bacteroidota bacterium]|nr:hypothetical protein [Bacteroidota bacterium]